jgi:hypothetical protein
MFIQVQLKKGDVFDSGHLRSVMLDHTSAEGRRAIARFHSDAQSTMQGGVPHWFRT